MRKQILLLIWLVFLTTNCLPNTAVDLDSTPVTPSTKIANDTALATPSFPSAQDGTQLDPDLHLPLVSNTEANSKIWQPQPGLSWQWDLSSERPSIASEAQVYDLDLYVAQELLDALKQRGVRLICYISVGSWEAWRPDAAQFPPEVLGKDYEGWQGEKWLDIRRIDKLAPIVQARLDLCAAKGFDAVEPDNMEVSSNDSGFPLRVEDERRYALWLAEQAHQRHLAIGMKNAAYLVNDLLPHFEFMITEDCFARGWCEQARPFIESNKAVFAAEYTDQWTTAQFQSQVCPQAIAWSFSAILKERLLNSWKMDCQDTQ
ncbi:MAG: endo alpha-1,4 polygalactosaminidase [Anaerolineales bacterium]|nr:endo alpha-1,4 polygalactosaminidase [Anaerolineales bacterium]MDW8161407.1 endo alpha-1,4 polygalactosaminidase [Anaerolineales bacterium]